MNIFKTRRARDRSARRRSLPILGILIVASFATVSRAESILISLQNVSAPVAGKYTWTYKVELTDDNALYKGQTGDETAFQAPDFAELYDFAGYVNGSIKFSSVGVGGPVGLLGSSDFSLSTPLSDHPAETAMFGAASTENTSDLANRYNLKMSYNDVANFYNLSGSSVTLGYLSAKSIYTQDANTTKHRYIGADTTSDGATGKNSATVFAATGPIAIVPTPQTVWGGLALLSVMGMVKGRRLMGL